MRVCDSNQEIFQCTSTGRLLEHAGEFWGIIPHSGNLMNFNQQTHTAQTQRTHKIRQSFSILTRKWEKFSNVWGSHQQCDSFLCTLLLDVSLLVSNPHHPAFHLRFCFTDLLPPPLVQAPIPPFCCLSHRALGRKGRGGGCGVTNATAPSQKAICAAFGPK